MKKLSCWEANFGGIYRDIYKKPKPNVLTNVQPEFAWGLVCFMTMLFSQSRDGSPIEETNTLMAAALRYCFLLQGLEGRKGQKYTYMGSD